MKKSFLLFGLFLAYGCITFAQNPFIVDEPGVFPEVTRREIRMPTIAGYDIMLGDFHMHTVFSDGQVWPTTRVWEAWRDGLDVIAISDHVEFRPKRDFVKGSLNRVIEIAQPEAERRGIMLINSAEITRPMPPGHFNALFLTDIDALELPGALETIQEARRQGAFIIWNHPCWEAQQPDTCKWFPEHEMLLQNDLVHGIEVYNWDNWYPVSIDWARDKNLAFFATTDMHGTTPDLRGTGKYLRPMTLVLVAERTVDGVRQAMFDRRTVAFFAGKLAGPDEWLRKIFHASVQITSERRGNRNRPTTITLTNTTDIPFTLRSTAGKEYLLKERGTVIIQLPGVRPEAGLPFTVTNLLTGANQSLEVTLQL
ncbi:MAG TPA: Sb-PDE family phosphodiesterase [Bacteroidales bacterium]|nr:Sb-PDE family phosphodiesterase [Bacteroidales bacterium]